MIVALTSSCGVVKKLNKNMTSNYNAKASHQPLKIYKDSTYRMGKEDTTMHK